MTEVSVDDDFICLTSWLLKFAEKIVWFKIIKKIFLEIVWIEFRNWEWSMESDLFRLFTVLSKDMKCLMKLSL